MARDDFIWRFTPSRTDSQVLEEIFVQRHGILADIIERVRESVLTDNKHQILLIGPRGIGKTHLITLLHHRIARSVELAQKIRIAWLLEDETFTTFAQLLKRIYESLAEAYPEEYSLQWLGKVLDETPAQIRKSLEATLVEKLHAKTLLLIVENLDLLFDGLGEDGQKRLRAFLQNHPLTSIVATSQRLFKGMKIREQPFFGFFATEHLRPLSVPDATELLCRVARQREQSDVVEFLATPEGRSRVRALHHIAGGNHRIYIVLSGFITRESLDELAGPFEKMVDELTPYYQERMRCITPQQRQIVEHLCANEETCTPKEIARHLLTTENTVSSQLKKLLELGYVLRNPRGRESLYELAEPLMRLASEVKEKRRKPLRLLVNFLRVWYRPDILPQLLAKAGTKSLRLHIESAITEWRSEPDPRLKILEQEIARARHGNHLGELVLALEERAHARGAASDWAELAVHQSARNDGEAAVRACDMALTLDPCSSHYWTTKARVLTALGQYEAAIECCERSLRIDPTDKVTWLTKGVDLHRLNQDEAAVMCYEKALEIDAHFDLAWANKGSSLFTLGRNREAVASCDKAIEIDPSNSVAWINRGSALGELGQHKKSVACYDKAIEIEPNNTLAWVYKSDALQNIGQFVKAIHCADTALKIDPECDFAWFFKGYTLHSIGRHADAIGCLEKALEIDSTEMNFWLIKGDALSAMGQHETAIACFGRALEAERENAPLLTNIGHSLHMVRRHDEARDCYRRVLELDSLDKFGTVYRCEAMFGLRQWEAAFTLLREIMRAPLLFRRSSITAIIDLVLMVSEGREARRQHVAALISSCMKARFLVFLGDGLIWSLRQLDIRLLDPSTIQEWRDDWLELGACRRDLRFPLRIFRAGVEYIVRADEKLMLNLVSSERRILRQALGLDEGGDAYDLTSEFD